MTAYRWTCHLCGAANEPGLTACQKCGFPAEATGQEVALARATGSPTALQDARAKKARARAKWKAQPFWVKVRDIVILAVFLVAIVLARLAPPIEYNLLGLVLLAGLLATLWIAHKVWPGSK